MPITGSLRDELLTAAQRVAPVVKPQEVSNVLGALATAGIAGSQALHSALQAAAAREPSNMNEQNVANTMWALARLQAGHGQLCSEGAAHLLFDHAAESLPRLNYLDLCQVRGVRQARCIRTRTQKNLKRK